MTACANCGTDADRLVLAVPACGACEHAVRLALHGPARAGHDDRAIEVDDLVQLGGGAIEVA